MNSIKLPIGTLILRNQTYWLDVTLKGRRIRESTQCGDVAMAEAYARNRAQEIYQEVMLNKTTRNLGQAIDAWLNQNKHKKDRRKDIAKADFFKEYWGDRKLNEINRQDLIDLLEDKPAAATKNRYTSFLSAVLKNAVENGWLQDNEMPRLMRFKENNQRLTFLTTGEIDRLLDALEPPHKQAAIVAVETGLRRGNVYGLLWSQVDFERRLILIDGADTKGGKSLRIPLTDKAYDAIEFMKLSQSRPNAKIFPFGFSHDKFTRAKIIAGLADDVTFHTLRHTWASHAAMNGMPLLKLQKLGGWSSLDMVLRYSHLSPEYLES